MKLKKVFAILGVIAMLSQFFGCTSKDTLDTLAFVNVAVISLSDDNKIKTDFYITSAAPSASVGEASNEYSIFSAQSDTFEKCLIECAKQADQTMFLGHLKTIVFSEDILQNSKRMEEILFYFCRNKNFNLSTTIYTIDDTEAMKKKVIEKDVGTIKFIENLTTKGTYANDAILTFYEAVRENGNFPIPLILSKPTLSISGICVMESYKKIAKYQGDQMVPYVLLTKNFNNYYFELSNASLFLLKSKPSIKVKDDTIMITVNAKFELVNTSTPLKNVSTSQGKEINKEVKAKIEKSLESYILENKKDIYKLLDLDLYMAKYHPKQKDSLETMQVKATVKSRIVKSGNMR